MDSTACVPRTIDKTLMADVSTSTFLEAISPRETKCLHRCLVSSMLSLKNAKHSFEFAKILSFLSIVSNYDTRLVDTFFKPQVTIQNRTTEQYDAPMASTI